MSTATLADVVMPQMGVSVEEGIVVAWHVAVGDAVTEGQAVCDVATDKVDTEVVATADGVVAELVAAEGETVAVGAPLVRLTTAGQGPRAPAPDEPDPVPRSPEPETPATNGAPAPANGAHAADHLAGAAIDPGAAADAALDRPPAGGGPLASPVARRLAAERGIDLAAVRGSGRRGRIRKADVLDAEGSAPAGADSTAPATDLPRGYDDVPHEIVATTRTRRAIAEHMVRSRQTAAHMTTQAYVDMHAATQVRAEINAEREAAGHPRISFLVFIARAGIAALADFPDLNATFQHERTIRWREVNLAVSVDTPQGLMAPVVRQAQRLTVGALADALADLGARGRAQKLTPEDLRAGTFTISNPGSLGGVEAPAIINQPQVAILGTPAIVKKPWVVQTADGSDAIVPRPIMKLALTYDHRAVDGAEATRYVVRVKDLLESWAADAYL